MEEKTNSGAAWLRRQGVEVSDFGVDVAGMLSKVWRGIYHLSSVLHERTEWNHPTLIQIVVYGELSTFDHNDLTQLVFEAHRRAIRMHIDGASYQYLRLTFHRRRHGEGEFYETHPTLGGAIAQIGYKDRVR